jgi:hypothetical protein
VGAYRENAAGEFEIYAHPWKGWYELAIAGAIGAGAALLFVLDDRLWSSFPAAVAVGLGFYAWRHLRRAWSGRPMVTIGPSGVRAGHTGLTTDWEALERVELFVEMSVSRYAAFHLRAAAPLGPQGFNVDLSELATTEQEFVGILRRFFPGADRRLQGRATRTRRPDPASVAPAPLSALGEASRVRARIGPGL